jgi:O-antigen/teichoic acid export membrane protein
VRGFSWMFGQTIVLKLLGLVVQFVLGRLLLPQDFGLIGLALTVTAFTSLIQDAGLSQILVHRNRHFRRWANAAFWMSLALGFASAAMVLIAIPVATRIYHSNHLTGLLLVLAAGAPIGALSVVPIARLQANMRFRALATVGTGAAVTTHLLTIAMAAIGAGPYSLVLPPVLVNPLRACILWWLARPPLRFTLHLRRWRYLIGDSGLILLSSFFVTITMQVDNIILGLTASKKEVGDYFFAFNLSLQTTVLLTGALSVVLFPALSALSNEPQRLRAAFQRAAEALAVIAIPLCVLQAVIASPILKVAFSNKWESAIPLMQILSLAMAVQVVNGAGVSLIQSQGKFKTMAWIAGAFAVVATVFVWIGSMWGPLGVAIAAFASATVAGLTLPYVAIKPLGGRLADVVSIYARPLFASAVAAIVAVACSSLIPDIHARNVWILIIAPALFGIAYIFLAWQLTPGVCREISGLIRVRLIGQPAPTSGV